MIPFKHNTRAESYRPSSKECWIKIEDARELVANDKWRPAEAASLQENWEHLEQDFNKETTLPEDQKAILVEVLEEIRAEHYAGHNPPEPTKISALQKAEMFAFCWKSAAFKDELMYMKFCFHGKDAGRRVYFHSLHKSVRST